MEAVALATCLQLLKLDLGVSHNARDVIYTNLLESSVSELERMGVVFTSPSPTSDDIQLIVDYSSWMYRKRAEDVGLPRRLRFKINNRIIQKAGT